MNKFYAAQGYLHSLAVDVPKPKAPDSDDIVEKVGDAGDWISLRSSAFWLIIVCLVITTLIFSALKKPLVKGALIGAIILAVAIAVVNN